MKVYLSPSIQLNNVGAGDYGTESFRMNQVADVVARQLARHGIEVYRNTTEMSLRQIVEHSNAVNPDIHFAIHSNASDGSASGCEVFCYKAGAPGEDLAWDIYNSLVSIDPVGGRGVKEGYNYYGNGKHMYEVAYTNAPAALVEIDFHDNASQAKWIVENIEAIGTALAKGILKNLKIAYIPDKVNPSITYRVMCGSFKDKNNAFKRVEELEKLGFDSMIMKV